ncbi:transcriptional regulator GcvA [Rhodospirillum rubrum]|uniref:Transcriptional regulator, LysR family n=1 Tax=Rhodospirillum rubrum (strain ATCC 11170 / ATH 1.1.1 / DSM 467 / LMG 4362 / NCIMB 8255 / S1) TaxID=269796 RepID=Q2RWA6_RHORT|nr:transcriptional regulator GcvA [Rhodospirillum rubrum]ABC21589.1 transcriptional regulator, LysR family [Rhodospirillum rubrum ATCC 11170]AEO47275.1 LysR family transcriptional regulator [Rhodospirillum rubrum F11]MBK5955799.1 LysR family transcriptional regulator [Rhodospirillum rubrum]QXG81259.1 transcriptional regulator GcvA [Rhodospirillum rubrum]HAP99285.1 LysR family transcriptional regulator [Rhodospirillum rubrum]
MMPRDDTLPTIRRRLPPLTALRTFEAVARHLSVTNAADELSVTPAAVSQQIRQLEDTLGTALLRRHGRSLALTDAGRALQPGLSEAFDRLVQAITEMRPAADARPVVRVAVTPSFAEKWLVPRLGLFIRANEGIDVHVMAGMELMDFAREPVDLAVRFGAGRYPGLTVELLREEEVFPVCAPALLSGAQPIRKVVDLRHHVLIHDDNPAERDVCPDWTMWLTAAGFADLPAANGPRFNQSSMVLEAAAQGLGVALAKGFLARADLESGRLARPFAENHALRFAYWVVSTPQALVRPEVRLFRDWLLGEAAE